MYEVYAIGGHRDVYFTKHGGFTLVLSHVVKASGVIYLIKLHRTFVTKDTNINDIIVSIELNSVTLKQ